MIELLLNLRGKFGLNVAIESADRPGNQLGLSDLFHVFFLNDLCRLNDLGGVDQCVLLLKLHALENALALLAEILDAELAVNELLIFLAQVLLGL